MISKPLCDPPFLLWKGLSRTNWKLMPAQLCARGLCMMQSEWLYVGKLQHKEHHGKKKYYKSIWGRKKSGGFKTSWKRESYEIMGKKRQQKDEEKMSVECKGACGNTLWGREMWVERQLTKNYSYLPFIWYWKKAHDILLGMLSDENSEFRIRRVKWREIYNIVIRNPNQSCEEPWGNNEG